MWIIEWIHAGAAECYCITRKARDLSKWKFHQAGFPGWNLFSTDCAGIRRLRTAGTCRAPRRGKRVDTKVSTLLTPTSFYFLVWRRLPTCDRCETGERQRIFSSVSFAIYSQGRIHFCYIGGLLSAGCGITVPHDSLASCDRQGLRKINYTKR